MTQIIDRIAALRVADIMVGDVLSVSKNQSMAEVAKMFVEHDLSAAPVVDELGHCVGIITAYDFVQREDRLQKVTADAMAGETHLVAADSSHPYRCVPVGEDFVSHHMSEAIQAIDPGASVLKAARVMCAEHIHRLPVIDDQNHPIGVVSTMDIVAAIANIVDEMNAELDRHDS